MNTAKIVLAGARVREATERFMAAIPKTSWLTRAFEGEGKPLLSVFGDVQIVFCERYFARNTSDLMLAVVFAVDGPDSCSVQIVSGGGKTGRLRLALGAEKSMTRTAIETLEEVATELSLSCSRQE